MPLSSDDNTTASPSPPFSETVNYRTLPLDVLPGATWMGARIFTTEMARVAAQRAMVRAVGEEGMRASVCTEPAATLAWHAAGILPRWTTTPGAPAVTPFDLMLWTVKGWRHTSVKLILDTRGPDDGIDGIVITLAQEVRP